MVVSDSSHLEAQLRSGHLDFACIQRPDSIEDVDMITLPPVRAVVVAHEKLLALPQSDTIHLHDLGQFPLVLLRRINGRGTFEFLLDKLRKNGIDLKFMINWLLFMRAKPKKRGREQKAVRKVITMLRQKSIMAKPKCTLKLLID